MYEGTLLRLLAYFSVETLHARREWHEIYKVPKGKNLHPRISYTARTQFRIDGEIWNFLDK